MSRISDVMDLALDEPGALVATKHSVYRVLRRDLESMIASPSPIAVNEPLMSTGLDKRATDHVRDVIVGAVRLETSKWMSAIARSLLDHARGRDLARLGLQQETLGKHGG